MPPKEKEQLRDFEHVSMSVANQYLLDARPREEAAWNLVEQRKNACEAPGKRTKDGGATNLRESHVQYVLLAQNIQRAQGRTWGGRQTQEHLITPLIERVYLRVNNIQQYRVENTKIKSTSGHCNGAIPVLLAALHSELERLKTTVAEHGQRLDAVEGTVGTLQQQSCGLQRQLDEQRQRTDGLHEALAAARKVPQAWQPGSQAVSTSKSSA